MVERAENIPVAGAKLKGVPEVWALFCPFGKKAFFVKRKLILYGLTYKISIRPSKILLKFEEFLCVFHAESQFQPIWPRHLIFKVLWGSMPSDLS